MSTLAAVQQRPAHAAASARSGPLCYLVTDWLQKPHGTEALAVVVACALARRGWRVRIFTLGYHARHCAWSSLLEEAGVRMTSFQLPAFRGWHLQQRLIAAYLWRRARQERPALLFAPTNDPLVLRTILARPADGAPIFVHDPNEAGPKCPTYHPLWSEACQKITGLSVHGGRQLDAARAHYDFRCPGAVVWPASLRPGISEPSARPASGPLRFAQLGRLHSQKGGEFLIGAFAHLLAGGAAAELHFYGDGPDQARLEALARSLEIDRAVYFHGRYAWPDLDRIAAEIDVAVMPSIYEGFGLVMLEMMSRGRPVISSDVGSSREILEGLGGGWVVRRADTGSLAQAMAACCRDRATVARAGREAAEIWQRHFTPEAMIERYVNFWENCTGEAYV